jgi:putative methyltransferase (TIGR04325 family)
MPPLVGRFLARVKACQTLPEWEYISKGWDEAFQSTNPRGWNVPEVLETYRSKWDTFQNSLTGTQPLGVSPEASSSSLTDISFQNTLLCFAYSFAIAAHQKERLTMLDWGGGIGHYYRLAQVLFPRVNLVYTCKDEPLLAIFGQQLFPTAHFDSDNQCFSGEYDFVLASSSLHYTPDWKKLLAQLSSVCHGYLLITRLPTVAESESFVFLQRAHSHGYNTEYLGWCLNRRQFLQQASQCKLKLLREFLIAEAPTILKAPESCEYRGFLFEKK